MIRKEHRIEIAEVARQNEVVLAGVAFRVADAARALISGCSAAVVVVPNGSEWRMLAQSGREDLSGSWRRLVAGTARVGDLASGHSDALVLPFAPERISAKLVVAPLPAISFLQAHRIVQPLLDAGGVLFEAALTVGTSPGRQALRLVGEPQAADMRDCDPPRGSVSTTSSGR